MTKTYDLESFMSVGQALDIFAEEASVTKGAGFTIAFSNGYWRINMSNQWVRPEGSEYPITRVWKGLSLYKILKEATNWIIAERKEIEIPIKKEYTLLT